MLIVLTIKAVTYVPVILDMKWMIWMSAKVHYSQYAIRMVLELGVGGSCGYLGQHYANNRVFIVYSRALPCWIWVLCLIILCQHTLSILLVCCALFHGVRGLTSVHWDLTFGGAFGLNISERKFMVLFLPCFAKMDNTKHAHALTYEMFKLRWTGPAIELIRTSLLVVLTIEIYLQMLMSVKWVSVINMLTASTRLGAFTVSV